MSAVTDKLRTMVDAQCITLENEWASARRRVGHTRIETMPSKFALVFVPSAMALHV